MTVSMTHNLGETRSASVPLGKTVARLTMGKGEARSKWKKTDACVMCIKKKQDIPRSTRNGPRSVR